MPIALTLKMFITVPGSSQSLTITKKTTNYNPSVVIYI